MPERNFSGLREPKGRHGRAASPSSATGRGTVNPARHARRNRLRVAPRPLRGGLRPGFDRAAFRGLRKWSGRRASQEDFDGLRRVEQRASKRGLEDREIANGSNRAASSGCGGNMKAHRPKPRRYAEPLR